MNVSAVITQKTNDEPRIIPTQTGARVEFELYEVSLDQLRQLVGKELKLIIRDGN